MPKRLNLAGKRFGRLTAVAPLKKRDRHGKIRWKCKCDCNSLTVVSVNVLRKGNTQSCGCLKREKTLERTVKQASNRRAHLELEKDIEQKFVARVKKETDWIIKKCTFLASRGAPDRLLIAGDGKARFIEFKRNHKYKPTRMQQHVHRQLRNAGCEVVTIHSYEEAATYLLRIQATTRLPTSMRT